MRIISGKLKGKSILFLKTSDTRPLKDSVRENIFNVLTHSNLINLNLQNSNILDLYSGVGSFGLEALFVSYMRGRGWYLPTADFLFWLIIGMPLTALIIFISKSAVDGYLLFLLFKQAINAVLYTAIASIVVFVFDRKITQRLKSQQPGSVKSLKQYLHYILWIMSAFCVIAVCLFLSRSVNNIQHQQIKDKLDISSLYLSRIVESYVEAHKNAVSLRLEALENEA